MSQFVSEDQLMPCRCAANHVAMHEQTSERDHEAIYCVQVVNASDIAKIME